MDSRYTHELPARPARSFSTHPGANRALPMLSRQIRGIATDGVEQPGALPVGWTAREPWLGADRYAADPCGPRNGTAAADAAPTAPAKAFHLTHPDGADFGVWMGADAEGALLRLCEHHGDVDIDGIEAEEVVEDLTLRAAASLPAEAYASPARRWARAFGVNVGQTFRRFAVPTTADDEPVPFDLDSMHSRAA